MLLQSPWEPRLADGNGSPFERLADALAEDILAGRLSSGDRLPAHRDLSYRLGVGLGTVTKAYAVLEKRGLVRTAKGSGTFVSASGAQDKPFIDLSRNSPPAAMTDRILSSTLSAVAKRIDHTLFNAYPPTPGYAEYRRVMAHWFARLGLEANPDNLLLTSGAQHAISIAFATASGIGGTIFMEEFTYAGGIALARHSGQRSVAVPMDSQGMMPEALDAALRANAGGRSAVYVIPTTQSPTTSTMGHARRSAIVQVCRDHNVAIIEDDVYALAASAERPPLASLAPERTFYINSLSKTLNPAIRIGGLIVPDHCLTAATEIMYATSLMVSPLSCAVMHQWILDGTAETIEAVIRQEAVKRNRLAKSILRDAMVDYGSLGYHVWLPMTLGEAVLVDAAARGARVLMTPPASTMIDPAGEKSGIRLCLGAPSSSDLTHALNTIASILESVRDARSPHAI